MDTRRDFLRTGLVGLAGVAALGAGPALAGGHGRVGRFTGASNHVTKGRAEIVVKDGKAQVVLLDDFWFDGAPDPKVGLGSNGFDKATLMGPLRKNAGKQAYAVPAGIDVARYNEVWIWCERFNVPLGVAKLN